MIEAIDESSISDVLPLIRHYQEFYEVPDIDDERNRVFFSQFGVSSEKGCLFGFKKEGQLVAFATVYFSYASSVTSKIAIMNDLYTMKDYRGQGVATALIKYCEQYAKKNDAVRLQWLTAKTNTTAQSVYEALGAKPSSWKLYTYSV